MNNISLEESHPEEVQTACSHALSVLEVKGLRFRPMNRKSVVNTKKSFVIGRTNLKTGLITIDIWTPRLRKPKKIASILRTLAHEVTHHQKPPYRQRFRGRWIIRQHYPLFYKRVQKNIIKLKKDKILASFFN